VAQQAVAEAYGASRCRGAAASLTSFKICTRFRPAARRHPDIDFLVCHAGFDTQVIEDPNDARAAFGADGLICSFVEAGRPKNVYAELGSIWRFVKRDADKAAHPLGKLLLAFGEDHVLWGTDSVWYGSPQDQIQAFRAFQISAEFRERHGFPALTP
jgi:hypothetical protein